MISPSILRELSWCAAKLREVARTLSALEVRLTVAPGSDKMTGLEPVGQKPRSTRLDLEPGGVAEPETLRLDFNDAGYLGMRFKKPAPPKPQPAPPAGV